MARYRKYRRSYSRGRSSSGGGFLGLRMETIAGLLAGYTDMDKQIPIPGDIQVGIATVPIKGLGRVKGFFQGVVFGNVLQQRFGRTAGAGTNNVRRF